MTAVCLCCGVSYIQDCASKRLASRARDPSSPFRTCESTSGVWILLWAPRDTRNIGMLEQAQ